MRRTEGSTVFCWLVAHVGLAEVATQVDPSLDPRSLRRNTSVIFLPIQNQQNTPRPPLASRGISADGIFHEVPRDSQVSLTYANND